MPARQAGEVAEAAAREREAFVGVGSRRDLGNQREGKHVRQVAHRGENGVVACRVELAHDGTTPRPAVGDPRQRLGVGLGKRCQHDVLVAEQRIECRDGSGMLGAGDRMPGHEPRQRATEIFARSCDDVLFGAARVGYHRARTEVWRDRREQRPHLADRR